VVRHRYCGRKQNDGGNPDPENGRRIIHRQLLDRCCGWVVGFRWLVIVRCEGVRVMADTILDGSGEHIPGHRLLAGTDLEIAYNLLGGDLTLRVNKAGVQVFGVVLENAGTTLTEKQLLELKTEKSDLVVTIGTREDTAANVGYRLGRMANKLIKATRDKIEKT
jgi:hypothetical protein